MLELGSKSFAQNKNWLKMQNMCFYDDNWMQPVELNIPKMLCILPFEKFNVA